MSFAFRASLCFLAMSLGLAGRILAQSQSTSSATTAQHSADEAALRSLAESFFRTWAVKDIDAFLRLWSVKSPELDARRKETEELFAHSEQIDLQSQTIRAVKTTGGQARVRLEVDVRVIEAQTGKEKAGYGKMLRTLECVNEEGNWKVRREVSTYQEIAEALAAAGSEQQRTALLAEEREFATVRLARALIFQGNRFLDQANYTQALSIYHLAQGIAEQLGDRQTIAGVQNGIGLVHWSQGDYTQALEYLQKSLVIVEALRDKANVNNTLSNIGLVYHSLGNYAQAMEYFQRALAADEALADKKGIAGRLNNIGRVYRVQGNYAQAMGYYQKSLALSEALGNKYGIALTLMNIGNVYRLQSNYAQAMESYQKSLALREAGGDKFGIASTLQNIGRVRYEEGNYTEALECLQKSLALQESIGDKSGIAATLKSLGEVYEKQGHHAPAMDTATRAAALAQQIGDPENHWKARIAAGVAYRSLNEHTQARLAFEESIAIIEALRSNVAGGEEEQQRFFESKVIPYHALVDLLTREGRSSEALTFAERAKGRMLLDVLHTGRINITKALTVQEQEQERKLRAELISLNTQVTRAGRQEKPDQARLGELKSLREKARLNYEAFQTSLYAAHPELALHRGEAPVIKADEIPALLPDADSALLEYVVTNEMTYLFTITKAAGVQVYILPIKKDELSKQTESLRGQLAGRDLRFRASAARLYGLLLKPAQAQLRGKTNLLIVPDDKLWELPFQALLAEDGRFVIETSAISYAPSLTVLREMKSLRDRRQAETMSYGLLALGNPAVSKKTIDHAALVQRDEKLTPLPEAEQEVKALLQLYSGSRSKVYVGAEASEDRVKTEAGQARILHFATHGILNNVSPMYSHLALAQGDAGEDGLLEAWELMQLDLKADLAVLSACETARGRFGAGEGMIGLTWAMFIAGVPATVVSQWEVESASTRDLMVSFHRQLRTLPAGAKAKASKAEALRQAALKLLKDPETRHPFYWAGFVLVGDGG